MYYHRKRLLFATIACVVALGALAMAAAYYVDRTPVRTPVPTTVPKVNIQVNVDTSYLDGGRQACITHISAQQNWSPTVSVLPAAATTTKRTDNVLSITYPQPAGQFSFQVDRGREIHLAVYADHEYREMQKDGSVGITIASITIGVTPEQNEDVTVFLQPGSLDGAGILDACSK